MYDNINAVCRCDFCNCELKVIYKIYSSLIIHGQRHHNECCRSCQQRRKYSGDIILVENKYYWR